MKRDLRIVGIAGPAGSGKDYLAGKLCNAINGVQYSFAYPIKQAICAMLEVGEEIFNDRTQKESNLPDVGTSPRVLAQTLGTEWGRQTLAAITGRNIWVDLAKKAYSALKTENEHWHAQDWADKDLDIELGFPPPDFMMISDVRFRDEVDWILSEGGAVIYLKSREPSPISSHLSESFDWVAEMEFFWSLGTAVVENDRVTDRCVDDSIVFLKAVYGDYVGEKITFETYR